MIESIDDTHMKTLHEGFCEYQIIIIPVFTAGEMSDRAVFMGTAPKQTLKEQVSEINRILYESMHKENLNGKRMNRTLCESVQRTGTCVLVQTQEPVMNACKNGEFYRKKREQTCRTLHTLFSASYVPMESRILENSGIPGIDTFCNSGNRIFLQK